MLKSGSTTTWENEMSFGMDHAVRLISIVGHVELQSTALPLHTVSDKLICNPVTYFVTVKYFEGQRSLWRKHYNQLSH